MRGFKKAKLYTHGRGFFVSDLAFDENGITLGENLPIDEVVVTDGLIVPGFIDEHIHGAGGADVMDGTREALCSICQTLVKEGTTSFLATTMTASEERLECALETIAHYKSEDGAFLLGVHLEGPFLSERHVGAQPKDLLTNFSIDYFERLQRYADEKIKLITLAPERCMDFLPYLKEHGVVISAGHTHATEAELRLAMERGLSSITHTYNAQSPLHHREIGVVGSALLYDELYTELIADKIHVSPSAIKLLIKNKPKEKVLLITDAMRAKGAKEGVSELGGQYVIVKDGKATLADGTLAGSVLTMDQAIKNAVSLGVSLADALDMASYNIARHLSLSNVGEIKDGYRADLTVLDKELNVVTTIVNGTIAYQKKSDLN